MRYSVEATDRGYRLIVHLSPERVRVFDEVGGHGPIEKLYGETERLVNEQTAKRASS